MRGIYVKHASSAKNPLIDTYLGLAISLMRPGRFGLCSCTKLLVSPKDRGNLASLLLFAGGDLVPHVPPKWPVDYL